MSSAKILSLSKDSGIKIRIKEYLTWPGVLCFTENDMTVELAAREAPDPNERELSPLEEAEEAKRLIGEFRTRHPDLMFLRQGKIRVLYEKSPGRESLRASLTTDYGIGSIILVIDERNGGGIHFFMQSKMKVEPEVYGHTQTAVKKVGQFLENLSHDLLNQPSERRKNSSKRRSHQRGGFTARVV